MTYTPRSLITIDERSPIDAFARLRFSQPQTLIDTKQLFDSLPEIYDDQQIAGGSGTSSSHNPFRASTTMSVSNLTAGKRVRQTYQRWNYRPGKSMLAIFTFIMGTNGAGVSKRIGSFDDNNGIFLEMSGTSPRFVIRSSVTGSPVDSTPITQSNWNADKLDGTGESGVTLDFTKAQIFFIDFEWLGVGTVRFGFFVDGLPVIAHREHHANISDSVYMSTPNLPIRYEIENDGTGGALSLEHICSTVISEGGFEELGIVRSVSRGATLFQVGNTTNIYPVLSIRKKSAYTGASIEPISISVAVTTAGVFYRYIILRNPTVANNTALWVSVTNSAVEYDISRTSANTLTGGTEIVSGYGSDELPTISLDISSPLRLGTSIAGVQDEFILAVQKVDGGGTENFFGTFVYREYL